MHPLGLTHRHGVVALGLPIEKEWNDIENDDHITIIMFLAL